MQLALTHVLLGEFIVLLLCESFCIYISEILRSVHLKESNITTFDKFICELILYIDMFQVVMYPGVVCKIHNTIVLLE